jgi:hypothetical protein
MAFSIVGSTSQVIALGAGPENITLPGTPAEDDIVILVIACDTVVGASTIATTGYTAILNTADVLPGRRVAYKFMGATPDTVVAINQSGSRERACLVQVWRGVDTVDPIDVAWTEATGSSDSPDPPQISNATDALVFAVEMLDDDENVTVSTWPTNYTNQEEETGVGVGAISASCAMASREPGSTPENPSAYTLSDTDDWAAGTFSLNPAAAAGGIEILRRRREGC